jgi:hypothetical protein
MGMFDNIKCKKELPLNEELKSLQLDWKEVEFQTKDLENCLCEYFLTEDGKLLERIEEKEYIPYSESEKKDKGTRPWDLWKDVIVKNVREEEINHHGAINFYTTLDYTEKEDIWVEFKAYFIYGKLDKIELFEYKKYQSRVISNEKWKEKMSLEEAKFWNRTKKVLRFVGWKWFWKKTSNLFYNLSKICSDIQYFIIRHVV